MGSNSLYTYDDFALTTDSEQKVRPNTVAKYRDDDSFIIDVFLYGELIMSLYSDGTVLIADSQKYTVTTKNRLNDALIPLGWKVVGPPQGTWLVRTVEPPYRAMEFRPGMILTSIKMKG